MDFSSGLFRGLFRGLFPRLARRFEIHGHNATMQGGLGLRAPQPMAGHQTTRTCTRWVDLEAYLFLRIHPHFPLLRCL